MRLSAPSHIFKIILLYVVFAGLWIVFSDLAVTYLANQGLVFSHIQTFKAVVFLLVTAVLLYLLLRRDFNEIQTAWRDLAGSEKRYRTAFENSPQPLWEADLSRLKTYVDAQDREFRLALQERVVDSPELRDACFSRIRTTDISETVYRLFDIDHQNQEKPPCAKLFLDSEYTFLKKELEAIIHRKTSFEIRQRVVPKGASEEIALSIRWMVLPGYENDYGRVLISAYDITRLDSLIRRLKVSEAKYRCLVKNTGEAVLVADSDSILFCNGKAEELFGRTASELSENEIAELIYRDDRSALLKMFNRCLDERKNFEHTCRVVDSKGKIHWTEFKFSTTGWGEKVAVLILIADISEKVVRENQLRQAKLLLEKVFDSLREAVFVIDSSTRRVIICNAAAEEIFGYGREELRGKSTRQLHVDDSSYKRFAEMSEPILESGKPFTTSFTMRCKDGREILTENTVTPVDELVGWTHGVISVVRDVTEQKRYEQALQESEIKYRRLLEEANEGIVVLQSRRVSYINKQMTEILDYNIEEILGSVYLDHVHDEHRQEVAELYDIVMSGKTFPPDREIRVLDSHGEVKWVRVNAMQVEWEQEPAVMALVTNISEQKALQEKTEEMEVRVAQAQKMEAIGTLAGGIAHDFNNILSAILGFTEMAMVQAEQDTSLRSDLEEVYSAGLRAKELVKQILTFARQYDNELQPLRISPIIKEVVKFLRSSIPASIEIQSDIRSESTILGNPTQVHQVIMNLCTNAVQSMKEAKGRVHISVEDVVVDTDNNKYTDVPAGKYIQMKIADNGTGIAAEHIDQIFEPYFTTKDVGEGTGLGLSLVYGIVESYGGKITVQSKLGEGSAFTILLPTVKGGETRDYRDDHEVPRGSEAILVIDDEEPIVAMLRKQLFDLGYKVTTQTKSREALELFRAHPSDFDLILTDMTMPGLTGDELAEEISSIRPDVPIIICTGYSEKASGSSPEDLSADAILAKPIIKADLARAVRGVLDRERDVL